MTEQNEGFSAGGALDAAVDAAVVVALADHLDTGTGKPSAGGTRSVNCLNCGTLVVGRYCIDCGQVTDTHVPTLGEVVGDAITSLFNLDSRLWRTLCALAVKPGQLTLDFLTGKRARYVPPLRLYLVMSVLFFLVASLEGIDADDIARDTNEEPVALDALAEEIEAEVARGADPDPDLPGGGINFTLPNEAVQALNEAEELIAEERAAEESAVEGEGEGEGDYAEQCEEMDIPFKRGGEIDTAIREACIEGGEDDYDSLKDAFADNVPLLTFLVIPVMAVVFKLFYVFTGRAYLGHLVFLCHTHAYTFLLVVLLDLLRMLGNFSQGLSSTLSFVGFALLLLYTPAYYFIAMRRVYAQNRALTFVKLIALMVIYLFVITAVFSVGFLAIALTN